MTNHTITDSAHITLLMHLTDHAIARRGCATLLEDPRTEKSKICESRPFVHWELWDAEFDPFQVTMLMDV
jgi:hypothetical protein